MAGDSSSVVWVQEHVEREPIHRNPVVQQVVVAGVERQVSLMPVDLLVAVVASRVVELVGCLAHHIHPDQNRLLCLELLRTKNHPVVGLFLLLAFDLHPAVVSDLRLPMVQVILCRIHCWRCRTIATGRSPHYPDSRRRGFPD